MLFFTAPAVLSFAGSHNKSLNRLSPSLAVALCGAVVLVLAFVIIVSFTVETPQKANLNGWGFYITAAALGLSVPTTALALCANKVHDVMETSARTKGGVVPDEDPEAQKPVVVEPKA